MLSQRKNKVALSLVPSRYSSASLRKNNTSENSGSFTAGTGNLVSKLANVLQSHAFSIFAHATIMEKFLRDWRQDALNKHQYDSAIFIGDKLLALTRTRFFGLFHSKHI